MEGVAGYGCLGGKERSTPAGTLGLNLMGARLYNPTTGRFLTPDYVSGGNPNTYTYPVDLLTDKQTTRLTALFAAEDHVEAEATWGIYRRIIHAYRHPTGQPAASR
ncbi:hypothetical protein [Kytococcus sedentarius]|uniref:hypothetical protein n=1 Tax=Kytococcus sedentarius TaxID=1276 RepID=UPI0019505B49|nr:hypothetical protein [Kytococcus sedentarius]QRO88622.1 hypothetical protein I6J30_03075 [Kytococcus sedentarius]